MTSQVKVLPSGHAFSAEAQETILDAALRQGIGMPYGCRNGACGACRCKVVSGDFVQLDGYADKALPESDRAQGYALLCRAQARGDLVIEAHEMSGSQEIPIKTLPCRVEKIERVHDVAILKLKLPVAERLQFLAGKARSFSIANAPHDDAFIELHVRHQPGGHFSEYVFNTMKEREIMRFKGPLGSFHLQEDSVKPIVFLASGTGFAPIKGIIEHAIHSGLTRPMTLYWGARRPADLYMRERVESWLETLPGFRFIPVLSDALPEDGWTGRTGFVHQAVMDDFADLSAYEVYACGSPLMVEAAHRELTGERGLPNEAFFSDAFFLSKDGTKP